MDELLSELRNATDFTLMLNEATDEGNHSELFLITRLVDETTVKNVFLDLLSLPRGNAIPSLVQFIDIL